MNRFLLENTNSMFTDSVSVPSNNVTPLSAYISKCCFLFGYDSTLDNLRDCTETQSFCCSGALFKYMCIWGKSYHHIK